MACIQDLLLEDGKDTSTSLYKIIEDNFSENTLNIIIRIKPTSILNMIGFY